MRASSSVPLVSLPLMGIGNARVVAQARRPAICLITPHGDRKRQTAPRIARSVSYCHSLPLMGIGNFRARSVMTEMTRASHYPSWGSETIVPVGRVRPAMSSLPLMGIGNLVPARPRIVAHQLITPHGDRKPADGGQQRDAHRDLITPHGDRKPDCGHPTPRHRCASHYPSWGSETQEVPQSDGTIATFSLPLMGIGNRSQPRPCRLGSSHLITPHGDRKPDQGAVGRAPAGRLITPHGIGNCTELPRPAPSEVLITPHGDRKLKLLVMDKVATVTHYPSWGSETTMASTIRWGGLLILITPHGDRKRAGSAGR